MHKEFVVSRIESSQDGGPYVYISLTDSRSSNTDRPTTQPQSPFGVNAFAFTSPEDMMKNLPKAFSNMFGGGGMAGSDSTTIKLSMREYEDMAIKIGDKVNVEIKKKDAGGI